MQRLEVSSAVRLIYRSLGVEGLTLFEVISEFYYSYIVSSWNQINILHLKVGSDVCDGFYGHRHECRDRTLQGSFCNFHA
jgi:hypothetical protein